MEARHDIIETWLTRPPVFKDGLQVTWLMGLLLVLASLIFFNGVGSSDVWMPVSGEAVFRDQQWFRLWTALFAHADWGHLISNLFLFLPLSYILASYFGSFLFPFLALLSGGLINWIVINNMPSHVSLLGISGVVYWMGAAYLTLYILIDRREKLRRRLAYALFLSLMLFIPESYKPEVSYFSHFVGFVLGVATAALFYIWNRSKFRAAEVIRVEIEDDSDSPWLQQQPEKNLVSELEPDSAQPPKWVNGAVRC